MPLGNAAAARVRLIVSCKECQHQVEPIPAEIAARYGARNGRRYLGPSGSSVPAPGQPAERIIDELDQAPLMLGFSHLRTETMIVGGPPTRVRLNRSFGVFVTEPSG
jgi:hypothetical protein